LDSRVSKRYIDSRPQTAGSVDANLLRHAQRAKRQVGISDPQSDSLKREMVLKALRLLPSPVLDRLVLIATQQLDRGATQAQVQKLADHPLELWADRPDEKRRRGEHHESAAQFCRRVYADWIASGMLTNETLFQSDPDLLHAFRLWVRRHPDDEIPGVQLRLPTLAERIAQLGPGTDKEEIIRLGYALNKEKMKLSRS